MANNKVLIINRQPPYGNTSAKESLDAALAGSAYLENIGLLFIGDGVFQLLKGQKTEGIQQKNFNAMLSVLPIYDVNNIYVHKESLQKRQLSSEQLELTCQLLSTEEVRLLLSQQDTLLNF